MITSDGNAKSGPTVKWGKIEAKKHLIKNLVGGTPKFIHFGP
jgi:hypothetical protein